MAGERETGRRMGFALPLVLLFLAVLAIMTAAFLSSMTSERGSGRAFGHSTRAELAAQAGATNAVVLLKAHFLAHPDSATAWEAVAFNGQPVTKGTVLYYREHPNQSTFDPVNDMVQVQPLMSGAAFRDLEHKDAALTVANPQLPFSHPDNSVDLNHSRFVGDRSGWIGSPTDGLMSIPVPWVEMKEIPDDPTSRVIARYAFWVEDESFKVNASLSGTSPRGAQSAGDSPSQIPFQGLLEAASIAGVVPDNAAATAVAMREKLPNGRFTEFRALDQLGITPNLAEAAQFEGTIFSGALNLSRSGARRLNLNDVIRDSTDPVEIRRQLDWLIAAIKNQLPDFGQRFYRINPDSLNDDQVTAEQPFPAVDHQNTYLQKIAANIRDYIDTDSLPTIVANDAGKTIRIGRPTVAIEACLTGTEGDNSALAIGKENVPYLDEFAIRVTLNQFAPPFWKASATGASYDFDIDYYFEFWNMTPKDIHASDLGPNPFLRIYNQAAWDTGGGTPILEGRPFEMPLPETAVFPAGTATVVTTDPHPDPALIPPSAMNSVIVVPVQNDSDRHYSGITKKTATISPYGYRVNIIGRSPGGATGVTLGATDYETRMLLGNDNGLIESMAALPIARSSHNSSKEGISINADTGAEFGNPNYFVRGGSLVGGPAPSEYGDPRTNNEQLFIRTYKEGGDPDQTRYFGSGLDNLAVPAASTFGALNANYVDPSAWPDRSSATPSPTSYCAPMIVADAPMKSIGELGHIFDPVRRASSYSGAKIEYSRGGGRTLAVGQPDSLWDKNSASRSREWTAWRLADIFGTTNELQLEGRININGVLRDNGAALKAALFGYRFSTSADSDPTIAGATLSPAAMDALVQQISDRLNHLTPAFSKTSGPFAERGELSELPIFSTGVALTGSDAAILYDRGREELFRRMVELVCTRGSIFSIYAVGQSIQQTAKGEKIVTATRRVKTTIQLVPVWSPPLPDDAALKNLDATDPAQIAARFRPPDRYSVRVLRVHSPRW